ncbi:glycosyltransferase involved in cell wall biosynthesis [Oxalobacteraceae bacterium GrIS 2.11]
MTPTISVCIVTYNHEKYIRHCLQSVVDQKVDAEFEVIVCDDCSTDQTPKIIEEFAQAYPSIIKPVLLKKNVGAFKNFIQTHNRAAGEFVSHCDGDDYFLPGKLQSQFDYLSKHQYCSVTWHQMKIEQGDQTYYPGNPRTYLKDGIVDLPTLLRMGSIGSHSSIMYRRSARKTSNEELKLLDYYYALEFLQSGYGYFIEASLGVYRKDPVGGSFTSSRDGYIQTKKMLARHYAEFLNSNPQYRKDIFVGALFNFVYDLISFRESCLEFLVVLIRSFSASAILDLITVVKIKIRLAKRVDVDG